ncbi:fdxN element site-specific recombinase XisF [Tolypothrix sp. NIES-4075]|nr:hypothetical protein [Tolypothrix sp. NIES-4075]GAX45585.1 fdxN element site-specific recombinase XisF [Tolypothrix sp. NIES-4075]
MTTTEIYTKPVNGSENFFAKLKQYRAIAQIKEDILLKIASLANIQTEWTISRDRTIKAFANNEFWDSIDSYSDKKRLLDECIREIKVDAMKVLNIKYRHQT